MRNPWMWRNPWMSLWVSGANTMAAAARAQAQSNAHRIMSDSVSRALHVWSRALVPTATTPAPKRPAR
jgi:hypothetical protein